MKSVGIFSVFYTPICLPLLLFFNRKNAPYQKHYRFVAFVLGHIFIKLCRAGHSFSPQSDLDYLGIQQAEGIVQLGNSLEGLFFRRKCENTSRQLPRDASDNMAIL